MKRTIQLSSLCFLICLNYYILRNLKDTLILTEALSGTEAIPFLKTWALIPATLISVSATVWLSNKLPFSTLFLLTVGFFTAFFTLFTFVLYPLGDTILPHQFAHHLQTLLPQGWKGFVAIIRYWPASLFYIAAECWTIIVWYILFSGFTNEILDLTEAKGEYPWIILSGNISAIAAGIIVPYLTWHDWPKTVQFLTLVLILSAIAIAWIFFCLQKPKKASLSLPYSLSFRESILLIFRSRYLFWLAFIVLGFNLLINLTEVVWKNEVLLAYPHPSDYNLFMSWVVGIIGLLSSVITIFTIRLQKTEWTSWALVTPVVTLGSALLFFTLPFSPVFLGSMHIILSRSCRYTLFDYTKETALIPLPSEEKFKAKTQIDGLGSRLGKGLSSGIFQGLLLFIPTISACSPIIFVLVALITLLSIAGIQFMGKEMKSYQTQSS